MHDPLDGHRHYIIFMMKTISQLCNALTGTW